MSDTKVFDPHSEGYRVDLETDPMRQAAHLLADAVSAEMLLPFNRKSTERALNGDASGLLTNTRVSLMWLKAQIERDPGTIINFWTATLMHRVGEWPGEWHHDQ